LRFDGEWFESVATPSVGLKRFAGGWGQQAFLVSLRSHQVVGVDHRAITMVARTSARLKVYRGEIDPGVALAWTVAKV
jgi:hypothetical protein